MAHDSLKILPDDFLERTAAKRKWAAFELDEKQVAIEERRIELKEKDLIFVKNSIQLLRDIRGKILDERTTMQYAELVKSITFT